MLNNNVSEIERLRVDIAEFFCEDVATFRLEDCFKIFHNFCQKFRKAIQVRIILIAILNKNFKKIITKQ